jgi:rod shape-determining protein MreB
MFERLRFFSTSSAMIFIDLGTANTVIVGPEGVLLNEPSVIALQDVGPNKKRVLGAGHKALELLKSSPGNIYLRYPLRDGVVADIASSEATLEWFFQDRRVKSVSSHPTAIIVVPFHSTEVERRGTIQIGQAAGAKKVILVDEPLAAALGAGLDIRSPVGQMIIDLGGGTVEVSIISLGDVVYCESLRMGGHRWVDAIREYLVRERDLVVSHELIEEIKKQYVSALPSLALDQIRLQGLHAKKGTPVELEISAGELSQVLSPFFSLISKAVFQALEKVSAELVSDIMDRGITLVGGGALTRHIDKRLFNETQIPTRLAPDPLLCMAYGGQKLLQDEKLLDEIYIEM